MELTKPAISQIDSLIKDWLEPDEEINKNFNLTNLWNYFWDGDKAESKISLKQKSYIVWCMANKQRSKIYPILERLGVPKNYNINN